MLMRQNPKRIGRTDISDLNEDPVVVWQHRHYLKVVLFMGLILPTFVCGGFWNDWVGGKLTSEAALTLLWSTSCLFKRTSLLKSLTQRSNANS